MKKRWHRIAVALVSVLLALVLIVGGVFAAYDFFKGEVQAEVEEAIALGLFDTWDNLKPYGSDSSAVWEWEQDSWQTGELGDITITLGETDGVAVIAIATIEGYSGAGFVAGEWVVIPVNFRNAGSDELVLEASAEGNGGLEVEYCWLVNTGDATEPHPDGDLNRDFKDDGNWASLNEWSTVLEGYGGESGSARLGAQVLFVRIKAPGDIAPSPEGVPYTLSIAFNRG